MNAFTFFGFNFDLKTNIFKHELRSVQKSLFITDNHLHSILRIGVIRFTQNIKRLFKLLYVSSERK